MIDRHMRSPAELGESHAETKDITRENIEKYIEGCEELAVRLDTVIEKVSEAGKKPVILIPSRGAVPIFLLARRFLNQLHDEGSYLNDKNAKYFPQDIFNYLEGSDPQPPDPTTSVDIVLYPFTADVTLEGPDDETIAKELRNSCARSIMEIVQGRSFGELDYEWYKFLMNKLSVNSQLPENLKPEHIVASLDSFPSSKDTQIILIDTVISGRAANDITNAFKTLGHTVIPILAVDNTKGGKFQPKRKAEIQDTLRPIADFLPDSGSEGVFIEFPLLTEDKGAALLGLVALNFINFNEEGIFNKVNHKMNRDFRPQSCVWTLPPKNAKIPYLANFRRFIDTAWHCRNGSDSPCSDVDIEKVRSESKELTSTHHAPTHAEINALVPVDKNTELKESASHIVAVKLPEQQAAQWIKEFSSKMSAHS